MLDTRTSLSPGILLGEAMKYISNYCLIYFDIFFTFVSEMMATLAEIRKAKHLTMVDIAAQLGISQGYYSNLERGKRPFNDALLKKTAKVLGVPFNTTRDAVQSHHHEPQPLKSWMSSIRINGLPLIKAFHYYLETQGIIVHSLDDAKLKKKMKEFIEANIGFSILSELSEKKVLLNHMRELLCTYSTLSNNTASNKESKKLPMVTI